MQIMTNSQEMAVAVAAFEREHWDSLPTIVQQVMDDNRGGSLADFFARTAEALYANRALLDNEASSILCGQLAAFCGLYGIHAWRAGRGFAAQQAMARDLEETPPEGMSWPDPGDDPEPDPIYVEVGP